MPKDIERSAAMPSEASKGVDRRGFLRSVGKGAAGTGAVAVAATGLGVAPAEATESRADRLKARYRETDHVKTFYRTNRY
jgi:hypothetical protein